MKKPMGRHRRGPRWWVLSVASTRVAIMVLVVALVGDAALQVVEPLRYGADSLDGSGNALAWWDLVKATATVVALFGSAKWFRSGALTVLGVVYFAVATEDQLGLHHAVSRRVSRLLAARLPDITWASTHVQALAQLLVLTLFASVGFVLIWVWRRPASRG